MSEARKMTAKNTETPLGAFLSARPHLKWAGIAKALEMPVERFYSIVRGTRAVTTDEASAICLWLTTYTDQPVSPGDFWENR